MGGGGGGGVENVKCIKIPLVKTKIGNLYQFSQSGILVQFIISKLIRQL